MAWRALSCGPRSWELRSVGVSVSALPTHYAVFYPTALIKANKSFCEAVSRNCGQIANFWH